MFLSFNAAIYTFFCSLIFVMTMVMFLIVITRFLTG